MTDPKIVLDGDVSPFRRALREAGGDLAKFGKDGEKAFEGMNSPLGKLVSRFTMVTASIAAFAAAGRHALGVTAEWTESAIDLGNALGVSATAAGNLQAALAKEGVTSQEFMGAAQKLSANLKDNESSLNAMGLATRDAAGNLRPLNEMTVDAIELVGQYKAGTDRAMAANELFGKGFEISGNLAKINSGLIAEVTEEQKKLGQQVSQESVAAFEQYDSSMKTVVATIDAAWRAIGTALMPVLADLGNWFSAIGPAAITVVKGALGGLLAAFHLVTTGVTVLWETLNAMIVTIAEPIRALSVAIARAVTGDFSGAADEIKGVGSVISGAWGGAMEQMSTKAQGTRDRIWALFAEGTAVDAPEVKGRSANALVKKDKEKKEKKETEKTAMPEYEAKLDALRMAASQENALREFSKAEELAYWSSVSQQADVSAKDRMAIERKVTDLTLAVRRAAVMQGMAYKAEEVRATEALALERLEVERSAMQAALDAEDVTKQQALEAETAFEQRRYEIKLAALQANLRLAELDPNTSPVELARIHSEIEQLELQHQIKGNQIRGQMSVAQREAAREAGKVWEDLGSRMESLWDKGMNAMMNGTLRWRSAVKAIGAELTRWFVQEVVFAQVKAYLAGQVKMLAAKIFGTQAEVAAQSTATTAIVGQKVAETGVVTTGNAIQAGTGAAKSQAGIPYIGPILAIAAMAAIFAAVMGMGSKMKSARGGFDIPSGLDPITQLHEEEMVLPKEHANTIRGLADGEGQGGGAAGNTVNVYPRGRMTRQDARDSARHIAEALSEIHGKGWRPA